MKTLRLASVLFLIAASALVPAPRRMAIAQSTCEYWAAPAPAGNDSNPGTFAQPWETLDYASQRVLQLGGSNCTDSVDAILGQRAA